MKLTTRRAVIIGLLLAQALILLALFFVSGRLAATAESDHQNALLNTESAEAIDRMRAHLQPAEAVVRFARSALGDPAVEPSILIESFQEALEQSPQLDGLFVGLADGSFTYLSREDEGYTLKTIEITSGVRETTFVTLDGDGNEVSRRIDPNDEYDPVLRPWYQEAIADTSDVTWTTPYVFYTSEQVGITSAAPIMRDGEAIGVVGADLELGSLSLFLNSLDSGTGGGAIIVNQDGVVIAHPDPDKIQQSDGETLRTVAIADLDDPLARAAVASFVEQGSEGDEQLTSFSNEIIGESRGSFRTVSVGSGEWIVGVFGPKDSLVGSLASARAAERTLLIVASVLGLTLVAMIGSRATRPLDDLEQHAWSDSLTGLPNRRSILRSVERHLDDTNGQTLSIAILDIDRFKSVNDTYGHQIGDEVLAEVADRVASQVPEGASVGRIGGEEFLLLLPEHDGAEAKQVCESVRLAVHGSTIQASDHALDVTVSVGVATANGTIGRDELIGIADRALHEAKAAGRDQVVSARGLRALGSEAN